MKVGVYRPSDLPESFNVCIDNIIKYASHLDVDFVQTTDEATLASCDVLWDPRAGGGHAPVESLYQLDIPLVVTLHGIGPLIFPSHYSVGFRHRLQVLKDNRKKKNDWKKAHGKYSKIVTVSNFSKRVINEYLGVDADDIQVVYNGVDTTVFNGARPEQDNQPYFLHVSNDESRKNVDRIIKAYSLIKEPNKWPLVLKLSSDRKCNVDKVKLISQRLSNEQLSDLYQKAGAFLFPSIYEGFGIPIIEAMASQCPVITSANTACEEVAGEHGILVNATSVHSIKQAMIEAMERPMGTEALFAAQEHAKSFGWEKASEAYFEIFNEVVRNIEQ